MAKKSLGIIHVISTISAVGIAIGTAALILILSVYNGFDRIIEQSISDLDPDLLVTPVHGKYFIPEGPAFETLLAEPRVLASAGVLQEEVFVAYGGRQELALAKGVPDTYESISGLAGHVIEGEFSLEDGDPPQAALGFTLAQKLGVRTHFLDPLVVYYPRRGARIPLAGPASALGSIKLQPGSLLSINATEDERMLLMPLSRMRSLLGLEKEISGLELQTDGPADRRLVRKLQDLLGPEYRVLDRYRQNPSLYKMMRYEKLAIYLILLFVVIIIATNIFGSLSMLAIAKREDMQTLRALGATDGLVRRIFIREGWLVSFSGLLAGLVFGIALALLQQHFGLVKMPGGFFVQAYPVVLEAGDVLLTAAGVGAIGILISYLAAPAPDRQ